MRKLGEEGNMILIVGFVLAGVLAMMVVSLQSYLGFRGRLKAHIREAYANLDALDAAAQVVRTVYDSTPQNPAPAALIMDWTKAGSGAGSNCMPKCQVISPGTEFCVENPANSESPYCFSGSKIAGRELRLEMRAAGPELPAFTRVDELYLRIANSLSGRRPLRSIDELLIQEARAGVLVPRAADVAGTAPLDCTTNPTAVGCITCSGNDPGTVQCPNCKLRGMCVTIYACPKHLRGCPGGPPALSQTIFMLPSGYEH